MLASSLCAAMSTVRRGGASVRAVSRSSWLELPASMLISLSFVSGASSKDA
jgi:hypothetical protein